MGRLCLQVVLFFAICSSYRSSVLASINTNLVNSEVTRNVDISSQIAKSTVSLRLENSGDAPASSFHVPIDASLSDHLAYISASVSETILF